MSRDSRPLAPGSIRDPAGTGVPVTSKPAIELDDAWKLFGHVAALQGVSLSVQSGEVLAVVGDNGAGKSTLLKTLAGVYRLDRGDLTIQGHPLGRADPAKALRLGVAAVFQDLALVETLDVATNMYLGNPLTSTLGLMDRSAMFEGAAKILQDLKVRIPSVRVAIGQLSGGQRQSVAIARAVLRNTPILLLDEPTAALGVREREQVGAIVQELRGRGKAVLLISHDLEFVFQHADRVQVLRLGTVRGVRQRAHLDREEIVGLITGLVPSDEQRATV